MRALQEEGRLPREAVLVPDAHLRRDTSDRVPDPIRQAASLLGLSASEQPVEYRCTVDREAKAATCAFDGGLPGIEVSANVDHEQGSGTVRVASFDFGDMPFPVRDDGYYWIGSTFIITVTIMRGKEGRWRIQDREMLSSVEMKHVNDPDG